MAAQSRFRQILHVRFWPQHGFGGANRPSLLLVRSRLVGVPASVRKLVDSRFGRTVSKLQFSWEKPEKSLRSKVALSRPNSLEISKADTDLGMSQFDPSQGSHAVTRP
jgi:hypothetical protein